ncbi:MAG: tetratricopeptide repeat protein [Parahaliea sp.]
MKLFFSTFLAFLICGCVSPTANEKIKQSDRVLLSERWRLADTAYQQQQWQRSYDLYLQLSKQIREAEVEFRKGVSAFRLQRVKLAEASFEKAIEINPNYQKALFNLALINMSRGYAFMHQYVDNMPYDERPGELEEVLEVLEKFSKY